MYWLKRTAGLVILNATLSVLVPCASSAWSQPQERRLIGPGQCVQCHEGLSESALHAPAETFDQDIHGKAGLGCADCHGGDPGAVSAENAHGATAGYLGVPEPMDIPPMCGACHADAAFMGTHNPSLPVNQLERYATSRHGELLAMGLRKVAQCASCHTAHNVRSSKDTGSSTYPLNLPATCAACHANADYMSGFPIPTDQFDKYAASVHGQALLEDEDLGSPACNDCHGNHGPTPPGVESLTRVCGSCHALNAELAGKSAHADVIAMREVDQCIVCHGHHAIAPPTPVTFNMGPESICISCHRQDDPGWKAGKRMFEEVNSLITLREKAEAAIAHAQDIGMDVADARFFLVDFRKNFLQMRTKSHALDIEDYLKTAQEAREKADGALAQAETAIDEFHLRRRGLLISLLLSLPVLVLLYVKIQHLDLETAEKR